MKKEFYILFFIGCIFTIFSYLWLVREESTGFTLQGFGTGMMFSAILVAIINRFDKRK